jgi:hypothetical protein
VLLVIAGIVLLNAWKRGQVDPGPYLKADTNAAPTKNAALA